MATWRKQLKDISTALEQDDELSNEEMLIDNSIPLAGYADHSDKEASKDESEISRKSSAGNSTVCAPWSATFLNLFFIIFPQYIKHDKKTNVYDYLLISLLLYAKVSAFLLKCSLLRLHELHGQVYLGCVKIKRNENTCFFSEHV